MRHMSPRIGAGLKNKKSNNLLILFTQSFSKVFSVTLPTGVTQISALRYYYTKMMKLS